MNSSLSFDRAADFYDQTRPVPEAVARQGIQAILDLTGAAASIPLLERGVDLVGCDLSSKMLARLMEKFPSARIAQADASRLPFPAGHFEAVLTVHVIHLIAPWREALREFRRVLVPAGVYLNVRTYATVGVSVREEMRTFWRQWVESQGVSIYQPGVQDYQEFLQELRFLDADLTEVDVVRFPFAFTLRDQLDRFSSRVFSDTWHIPDDVYDASLDALRAWVTREYGDLDRLREDQVRFVIDVARFP